VLQSPFWIIASRFENILVRALNCLEDLINAIILATEKHVST
jgi:hypothetical protein